MSNTENLRLFNGAESHSIEAAYSLERSQCFNNNWYDLQKRLRSFKHFQLARYLRMLATVGNRLKIFSFWRSACNYEFLIDPFNIQLLQYTRRSACTYFHPNKKCRNSNRSEEFCVKLLKRISRDIELSQMSGQRLRGRMFQLSPSFC